MAEGDGPTPARLEPDRTHLVALALISSLFVLWGACYVYRTSIPAAGGRVFVLWDDGMISMRYARNLASGHGLTWNPDGERVQGISNPGFTLVMMLVHLLPVEPRQTSLAVQLLALALATACLPLVYTLAFVVFGDGVVGVAAAMVTALYAPFAIWSLQGTDVAPIAILLIAAAVLITRAWREGRPWPVASFVLLAAAILVRADASVPYVVALALCAWRQGVLSRPALHGAALLVAAWAALLALGYAYYGDPLPNTYYLKATGSPRALVLAVGLRHTLEFVRVVSPVLIAMMAVALAPDRSRRPAVLLMGLMVVASLAYNTWIGGDWVEGLPSRFVVPALPLFIVLAAGAWWRVTQALLAPGARRTWAYLAGAVVLAVQLNPGPALAEWLVFRKETLFKGENVALTRLGLYLRDRTAPETTVAFHWAGLAAYFAERTAIDVLGKSDRHIARMSVDRFIPGHSKWDWDYVIHDRKPDILLGESRGLLVRADFRQWYRAARTESGQWMFVRRGSEAKVLDPRCQYVEIPDAPPPAP